MCHVSSSSANYEDAYYSREDVLDKEQRSYELPDKDGTIIEGNHKKTLAANNADINVHANLNRRNAACIGGSMLASMSTFHDIALSYSDYQEKGKTEKETLSS